MNSENPISQGEMNARPLNRFNVSTLLWRRIDAVIPGVLSNVIGWHLGAAPFAGAPGIPATSDPAVARLARAGPAACRAAAKPARRTQSSHRPAPRESES